MTLVDLEPVPWVEGQVPLPGLPEGALFPVDPALPEALSVRRRRTLRQRADVDRGIHPLTGGPARPELGTCGGCSHRVKRGDYPKCELGPDTRGPRTDVRGWWPACDRFALPDDREVRR